MYNFLLLLLELIFGLFSMGNSYEYNDSSDYSSNNQQVVEVFEEEKPAMVMAMLLGDTKDYSIANTYHIDYLSNGVVGQVGVPICVSSSGNGIDDDDNLTLVFVYDEDKLDCDETELGILWYNEEANWYDTLINYEADYENNQIIVPVKNEGTYILENMTTWVAVWDGTYVYEDTMMEPDADWHNEFYTDDIEKLADTSIYDESGEYHIYTIEELAGLVKLVNEGRSFEGCSIYLENDLDLAGYQWAPIGWYHPANDGYLWKDFPFAAKFYGNGHIIYNLTLNYPEGSDIALFGRTVHGFEVHDLGLVDCYIQGNYCVGAFLGDNINPGETYDITNCFVTGTITGLSDEGVFVGSSAYIKIKDCYAYVNNGEEILVAGDLRGGEIVDCHVNDEEAYELLAPYLQ